MALRPRWRSNGNAPGSRGRVDWHLPVRCALYRAGATHGVAGATFRVAIEDYLKLSTPLARAAHSTASSRSLASDASGVLRVACRTS